MKMLVFCVFALLLSPINSESKTEQFSTCSEILEPVTDISKNAKGVALIYNIERKFNDKRTSLSVHALHLPNPSSYGNYDSYEVLAYIPEEISWVFRLHPMTEHKETIWVGKEEEISFEYKPIRIKVRTFNTATSKSGPVVLQKNITCSK
ncbi:hypothetical protein [Niallia sp. NCCP-28]|uniref:hypothetical protein n=1 Tax=Niallia sp. NCCP-28 TaxID=2934712 RepID=UPI0020850F9A|nr:hypothetical protein [Niallia sp. NCCP-28]GKU84004.1 hypothetical protein NCCP28_34000 [Niallia sp. NCCP-28]